MSLSRQWKLNLDPALLLDVVRGGRGNVPVPEVLAGGLDTERRGHQGAGFLAQGVNGLLLRHALALEPCVQVSPGAISPIVSISCGRIRFPTLK